MPSGGSNDPETPRRTYRCPVCSHVDEVPGSVLREGADLLGCSHCGTALEVDEVPDDPAETVPVRVAPSPPE